MPTIHLINSIKTDMYAREHLPPHFYAIYAEYEILIEVQNLRTYAGYFPSKVYKQVIDWASSPSIQKFLMHNFNQLNPHLRK